MDMLSKPDPVLSASSLKAVQRTLLVISLPVGLLGFMLPIYGHEIGAGAVQIGLFVSVFSLARVLVRPLVGLGLDRYGRKPFVIGGAAGYALSMFAFAFADLVWGLVIARVLQGIGAACLWLAVNAVIADLSPQDKRGRTFGMVSQTRVQGRMLGMFAGLYVLFSWGLDAGWRLLFIGYGISGLCGVLLAGFMLPETKPPAAQVQSRPLNWSRIWGLLLFLACVTSLSQSLVAPTMTIFMQNQLQVGLDGLLLAYLPASLVLGFLSGRLGLLVDYYGRKPLLILGMVVAAGSSLILPNLTSIWGLALLRLVQAVCFAASGPALQALVADLIGPERRGQGYGMYALAGGLGQAAGPIIGGLLYETIGPAVPFYVNGIVLGLCAVVAGLWLNLSQR